MRPAHMTACKASQDSKASGFQPLAEPPRIAEQHSTVQHTKTHHRSTAQQDRPAAHDSNTNGTQTAPHMGKLTLTEEKEAGSYRKKHLRKSAQDHEDHSHFDN